MADNTLSFNEALNSLENFTKETFVSELWVPSLKRKIAVKELNAKQQKKLLSSAIDSTGASYKPFFIKAFYEILNENCSESKEVIDSLTAIDRLVLTISMRNQISNKLKVTFTDKKTKEETQEDVDLSILVSSFEEIDINDTEEISVTKNNLKINLILKFPSIKKEVDYFNALPDFETKKSDTETLKNLVSEAYIFETSKFIHSVIIDDKDLSFDKLTVNQKYQFVEKLPAIVVQKVLEKISVWKNTLDKILTVTSSTGVEKVLEPDALLFLSN